MRSDEHLLLDMVLAAEKIVQFTTDLSKEQFENSELHQSAVIRELQVMGEAARSISPDTRTAHPEVAWAMITGMRNRIIHEYFRVDLDILWRTVKEDIPVLVEQLKPLIPPDTE